MRTVAFAGHEHGIAALDPSIARAAYDAGAARQILPEWSFLPAPVHDVTIKRRERSSGSDRTKALNINQITV
jgi:hypothetical protein